MSFDPHDPSEEDVNPMRRPKAMTIGIVIGVVLGFALVFGGFQGLVIVAVFMIVGGVVGRVVDGELDLTDYLGGRRRDR